MGADCKFRELQLQAANIYIRVCGNDVEVGISPPWDYIGRHEYLTFGTVKEVIKALKQLDEDIIKSVKELEDMAKEVRSGNES